MRGLASDTSVGAAAAYRTSRPVPAIYHEDPLFLALCAAFDDLLAPFVIALDCWPAYLDPWLAPADFLRWLGGLVGVEDPGPLKRSTVARAVRAYRIRGTAEGLRVAAADAAGVPRERVKISEGGAVSWAARPGAAQIQPFDPVIEITLPVPAGTDQALTVAAVRTAVVTEMPVFSQLRITVEEP